MKRARLNKKEGRTGKSQRWMFPVLIMLAVSAVLLVLSFIKGETQTAVEAPVYQYFLTQRVDYSAGTKLIPGQYGLVFSNEEGENSGDVTPIYYQDTKELILPVSMTWLDPSTGIEWAIPALSHLELDEKQVVRLHTKKKDVVMTGGFLSDGLGTYLFLEEVRLEFNGEKMTLPPFSFCSTANGQVRIYQYDQEELRQAEERMTNILISSPSRYYQADLTRAIYTAADGRSQLLAASPKVLPEYSG